MSTSFSPALDPPSPPEPEARPFPYAEAAMRGDEQSGLWTGAAGEVAATRSQEQSKREEAARDAGRQEGEARVRASFEDQLTRARDSVRVAINDFARERIAYYRQVEAEVVQLALSIAHKILHREAQVDPMLLAGMVRVALDQIESNTKVTIRVHPQYAADCRDFFARSMDPQQVPEVVEDPAIEPDRCILQTELGTTELGIEVQLKEIERGLLDLLAQRPGAGT